jgi:hypothetical protein
MTMHSHSDHTHAGGGFAPMTVVLFAILITLLLLFLVFAWNPWASGNSSGGPGQGGSDEPAQEMNVPNQPEQRLPR